MQIVVFLMHRLKCVFQLSSSTHITWSSIKLDPRVTFELLNEQTNNLFPTRSDEPTCTATEADLKLEILDLKGRGFVLSM